jgi:hypothetical protein
MANKHKVFLHADSSRSEILVLRFSLPVSPSYAFYIDEGTTPVGEIQQMREQIAPCMDVSVSIRRAVPSGIFGAWDRA